MATPLLYYTAAVNSPDAVPWMHSVLPFFPESVREGIVRYKYDEDRLLTFSGKLLLLKALKETGLDQHLSLADLQYTSFNRPYFNYPVDFNITHSGNYTLLAFTESGKIGVDIEIMKPLYIDDYSNVFSGREWNALQEAKDDALFYRLWARKEAVVKAIGKGLSLPLAAIDVTDDIIAVEGEQWSIVSIEMDRAYATAVAFTGLADTPPAPRYINLQQCIGSLFPGLLTKSISH
ncbi:hypothetical protein D3H65_11445 [Paraflavitalea soli]|uniref:Uncharacterized protein n=1 Tax=Paraflavitalea soli TaxID=2315862 RepID=A0A3B7MJC3_9BACT|nr:4'-phosphopantetheinyl transferase superfamily protein [Paraflavitalea soli]AXY74554.1 hypothetical protein D3H65_11445 [Paraflavitalea soli]